MTNRKKPETTIHLEKEFARFLDKKFLEFVFITALESLETDLPLEASLLITGSDSIRQLNRKYLKKNRTTDVLSFPLGQQEKDDTLFIEAPDGIRHLGEVIISCPQAKKQAAQAGRTVREEIAALIIHGVLHLGSYDHTEINEALRMQKKEKKIMEKIKKYERNEA